MINCYHLLYAINGLYFFYTHVIFSTKPFGEKAVSPGRVYVNGLKLLTVRRCWHWRLLSRTIE